MKILLQSNRDLVIIGWILATQIGMVQVFHSTVVLGMTPRIPLDVFHPIELFLSAFTLIYVFIRTGWERRKGEGGSG